MSNTSSQPNVLVILFDHAAGMITGPGGICRTPNLDALASEGRRFGRCYTPNAICSPARASLMTGLYPSTHGMWDCTHTQRAEWVDVPAGRFRYFSQQFDEAGYRTGYFGKWHVEQSEELRQFGWQEYKCAPLQLAKFSTSKAARDRVVVKTPGYHDMLVAGVVDGETDKHPAFERGIDFLQRHALEGAGKPFCMCVSALEPHDPYLAPAEFAAMYPVEEVRLPESLHDGCEDKPELVRRMQEVWRDLSEADWRRIISCYCAVVSYLDREVGRIVAELKRLGMYENTIIVVTCDHGDMLGHHGLLTKGGGTPYEQVYRIPMVWRVPGMPEGVEDGQTKVSLVDVGPTLLDLCGLPPMAGVHGRSLRPVLDGTARREEWDLAYAEFFGQRFVYTQRITWQGKWKYVFSPGGCDELYDLVNDPLERRNRAADPECRAALESCCRAMWRKMKEIGDASLYNTGYATLRTAPIGPMG